MIEYGNGFIDERKALDCVEIDGCLYCVVFDDEKLSFEKVLLEDAKNNINYKRNVVYDFNEELWTYYRQKELGIWEVGDTAEVIYHGKDCRGVVVKVLEIVKRFVQGKYIEQIKYSGGYVKIDNLKPYNPNFKNSNGRKKKKMMIEDDWGNHGTD